MKAILYAAGRLFQIIGLIALPSAIWVGQLGHDERGAIAIFLSSVAVFFIGYTLTKATSRL